MPAYDPKITKFPAILKENLLFLSVSEHREGGADYRLLLLGSKFR